MCSLEKILEKYQEWLQADSVFGYIVRVFVDLLIKGLYWLSSTMEKAVDTVLSLTSFYKESNEVNTAYQAMLLLGIGFLTIFVIFLGYKFWLGKNIEIRSVFLNTLIIGASIVLLPTVFDFGLNIAKDFNQDTKSLGQQSGVVSNSLSFNIVKDNIVDLLYADQQDFPDMNQLKKNQMTQEQWDKGQIDLLENAEPEGFFDSLFGDKEKLKHKDVFKNQLTVGTDGKLKAVELNKKSFPFWDTWYFRYGIKSFTIISSLLVLSIAYGLSAMKLVRVSIELVVQKLIFPIVAFSDLETGQRLKGMWQDIAQSFLTIAMIGLNLRVFVIFQTWLGTKNLNPILFFFVTLIAALVAVDGADTFKKHFGTDVGLKDEWRSFLGMYAGAKAVGAVGGLAKDAVGSVANAAGKAGTVMKPHIDNIKSGKTLNDMKSGVQSASEFVGQQVGYMEEGNFMNHTAQVAKEGAKQFARQTASNIAKPFTTTASTVKDLANTAKEGYQTGNSQAIYDTIQQRNEDLKANATEQVSDNTNTSAVPPNSQSEQSQNVHELPMHLAKDTKPSGDDLNNQTSTSTEIQESEAKQNSGDVANINQPKKQFNTEGLLVDKDVSLPSSTNEQENTQLQGNEQVQQVTQKVDETQSQKMIVSQEKNVLADNLEQEQVQTSIGNEKVQAEPTLHTQPGEPSTQVAAQSTISKEQQQSEMQQQVTQKVDEMQEQKVNVHQERQVTPGTTHTQVTHSSASQAEIAPSKIDADVQPSVNQSTQSIDKTQTNQSVKEHQVNQKLEEIQDQKVNINQEKQVVEGRNDITTNHSVSSNPGEMDTSRFTQTPTSGDSRQRTESFERVRENQLNEHEHHVTQEINITNSESQISEMKNQTKKDFKLNNVDHSTTQE
ncbi:ABC transporter permease [Enterococcus cecorum]|nr:ABC transporter permease [Enterococcus cecorum]